VKEYVSDKRESIEMDLFLMRTKSRSVRISNQAKRPEKVLESCNFFDPIPAHGSQVLNPLFTLRTILTLRVSR
jgi:hypothetical protein